MFHDLDHFYIPQSMALKALGNLRLAKNHGLAELDEHQTFNPVMVGIMSSIPKGNQKPSM